MIDVFFYIKVAYSCFFVISFDIIYKLIKYGMMYHFLKIERWYSVDNDEEKDKKKVANTNGMTHLYWLPIGIALGSVMGISTNQLSLWLSLGIILGLLLSFLSRKN